MVNSASGGASDAGQGGSDGGFALADSACHVLVIDDDRDALEEYAEIIAGIGYVVHTSTEAPQALRLIGANPQIGLVLTDLDMPGMDGLSFLDHLMARFGFIRPIVPIVVTGHGSLDNAVQAMRLQAVDLLTKPVGPVELSTAIRRGAVRWSQLVGQIRVSAALNPPAEAGETAQPSRPHSDAAPQVPDALRSAIRVMARARATRGTDIAPGIFSDPAWDILLELTSARLSGKPVPVFSACAAAGVPTSTALRWIRVLVDAGLIRRWSDPSDRRRDLVELTDATMEAMVAHLGKLAADMAAIRPD